MTSKQFTVGIGFVIMSLKIVLTFLWYAQTLFSRWYKNYLPSLFVMRRKPQQNFFEVKIIKIVFMKRAFNCLVCYSCNFNK